MSGRIEVDFMKVDTTFVVALSELIDNRFKIKLDYINIKDMKHKQEITFGYNKSDFALTVVEDTTDPKTVRKVYSDVVNILTEEYPERFIWVIQNMI